MCLTHTSELLYQSSPKYPKYNPTQIYLVLNLIFFPSKLLQVTFEISGVFILLLIGNVTKIKPKIFFNPSTAFHQKTK